MNLTRIHCADLAAPELGRPLQSAVAAGRVVRGPFEHNDSCATLEGWFDPVRTNDTYVPTGWKGPPGT